MKTIRKNYEQGTNELINEKVILVIAETYPADSESFWQILHPREAIWTRNRIRATLKRITRSRQQGIRKEHQLRHRSIWLR